MYKNETKEDNNHFGWEYEKDKQGDDPFGWGSVSEKTYIRSTRHKPLVNYRWCIVDFDRIMKPGGVGAERVEKRFRPYIALPSHVLFHLNAKLSLRGETMDNSPLIGGFFSGNDIIGDPREYFEMTKNSTGVSISMDLDVIKILKCLGFSLSIRLMTTSGSRLRLYDDPRAELTITKKEVPTFCPEETTNENSLTLV